ncbi:MAG: hypothetical protein A2W93_10390 [Bacteroidetes bacterium GWF2_43_63]|nr:MAG: hypothetical protein A2W94_02080 [Bacteroidetes bacterium GWE2_42_42]OFY52929.1 MAG: hypothetical protein A2W93_10390 [Bacteroidetes bacterium GWF2_43_63]HBG70137.1 hypothetical protein [Bacteroidales bacterium]HCB62256.1 hypothetical protein [Bacteroidales bacterium]
MFFALIILLSGIKGYGQLTVTSNLTASQYVDFLVGSGITYSNAVYTGAATSIAKFTTGATNTNLGLTSGVVMSTGFVIPVTTSFPIGSPAVNFNDEITNGGTDANLQNLVSSNISDVAKIEFDFIPVSDTIKFRYVFGSEEYLEWVGTNYNDVFGFFISGPNPAG